MNGLALHFAILIQCRLQTDRQTDGQTDDDSTYHTSIALCGGKIKIFNEATMITGLRL